MVNHLLKKGLKVHDHFEVSHTPGLFVHKTRPIWFTLTVDSVGVKYIGREHAEHSMPVLQQHYKMDEDWKGELYRGITLTLNYEKGYVDISMPNCVHKTLIEYEHELSKGMFYQAVVDVILLYGGKSWMLPPIQLARPEGFHVECARQLTDMKPCKRGEK